MTQQVQGGLRRLFFEGNTVIVPNTADVRAVVGNDKLALPIFGHNEGLYGLPTIELIDWLSEKIGNLTHAIEVGAGCGVFGRALGIRSTDSFIQNRPDVRAFYERTRQPVVSYGENVEQVDANQAAWLYRPQVIFGSWVTHKYDETRHVLGGSVFGIDETSLLTGPWLEKYIVYGNEAVHDLKPIVRVVPNGWRLTKHSANFMLSRAQQPNLNCIYIFERS